MQNPILTSKRGPNKHICKEYAKFENMKNNLERWRFINRKLPGLAKRENQKNNISKIYIHETSLFAAKAVEIQMK